MAAAKKQTNNEFHVSSINALLGSLVHNHTKLWRWMGDLESRVLRADIDRIEIDKPVFIAGLARSGSTILLELIAQLEETCTHQYRDFPPIFTPFWWNWLVDRSMRQDSQPTERAHGDRIKVTPESPEAFEEPLWMAFFPEIHNPAYSNVIDDKQRYPEFERFYKDHIRKLMLLRNGTRYVSKGNYNISRLQYLKTLFPEARFVIPVREPAAHIASLMKQHKLFYRASAQNKRARDHLRWVGHFEFGLDRIPVNMGNGECIDEVIRLWDENQEVRGWARYWNHIYATVMDQLEADRHLENASIIVRYEDFCRAPVETVQAILAHTEFSPPSSLINEFCSRITLPDYYSWSYSDNDLEIIKEETASTFSRLGFK
ncbi:MAG: sulfotransferase [Pseudomonadota bacterium]